ncbi:MAG TPA: nuclear transport factor 2 family protein [Saprospiraceae bacterium]|nr:nuclear transport factor 2 family protein [Saprospiraceae bacterium]
MNVNTFFIPLTLVFFVNACASSKQPARLHESEYTPASQGVYNEIVAMDKKFFDAYNTCDIPTVHRLISDDVEFYHDLGGLSTSKNQIIDGLKNNICGRVTRVLKEGSIEVYPIKDYGAVQMGQHGFYNRAEKNEIKYAKFVHIWRLDGGVWQLARVVSLH